MKPIVIMSNNESIINRVEVMNRFQIAEIPISLLILLSNTNLSIYSSLNTFLIPNIHLKFNSESLNYLSI